MSQKTTITISTGSVSRAVDAGSLFAHLAVAMRDHDLRGEVTIRVKSDGTVKLNGITVYTPPKSMTGNRAG